MCGFIHDNMKVKSVCDLFEEAVNFAARRKNMELVRGSCLMLKKEITGVTEGKREPIVISVEGDMINCMEGDGSDKPMSLSRAEVAEFYDIVDVMPEEDMEASGY